MRFQIDWADLIVGSKFNRFCFVLLCILVQLSKYKLPGGGGRAYIWRGDFTEGFLRYRCGRLIFGGLIYGGAYFWSFTVSILQNSI